MKNLFKLLLLAALLGTTVLPCTYAEPEATEETAEELAAVPASLKDRKYVTKARPDLKAKVYFIYQSRYRCGICVAEAPAIVAAYKKMKGKGVELVMLNVDQDDKTAADWAKKAKMKFPIVSPTDRGDIPFPFTGGRTLPCMALSGMDIQNEFPLITEIGLSSCITDSRYMKLIDTRASEILSHNKECASCEHAMECLAGCRAAALENTPDDILAPDKACCEIFKGGWVEKITDLMKKIRPDAHR